MKSKTHLVFIESVDGHRLEYLHHIYIRACSDIANKYIFLLPKTFLKHKNLLDWPSFEHLRFCFMSDEDTIICDCSNPIKKSWAINRILTKYAKNECVDTIFLISLILIMPFAPFFRYNAVISGIIYKLYLYENKKCSFLKHWVDVVIFSLLSKSSRFKYVYILNDRESTAELNRLYSTKRFLYLPDPVPVIDTKKLRNIRTDYNIPMENIVYLQYGTLDERKNTITILEAIDKMPKEKLMNRTFIFSGRVSSEIKNQFYELVKKLESKAHILVFEGFISYDLLNNLCYSSDIYLVLYNNTSQSSGTIGYAGYFNKSVIGSSQGLLGRLIKENALGYTIDEINVDTVKDVLCRKCPALSSVYCETHTVEDFCNSLSLHFRP